MPARVSGMTVRACDPSEISANIVFSALDSSAAATSEPAFAGAGKIVLTNAKNFRMEADVPLVIAEVNPEHLDVIAAQRKARGWDGAIVANGNCSAIVTALPLAPIHQTFGITKLVVATMQAISGARYPGVASLATLRNVIPYIRDEEQKIEGEVRKFLGTSDGATVHSADFPVSAHANRVPVEHGHTVVMSVGLSRSASPEEVSDAIAGWRGAEVARGLPSAPEHPLEGRASPDHPHPRRQVDRGGGMTVTVGRIRPDPVFDVKFVAMGHNVIRGAARASVLNADRTRRGRLGAERRADGAPRAVRRVVIVLKFGGTSVGDAEAIARAGRIVGTRADQGGVVVVSALGAVANTLV